MVVLKCLVVLCVSFSSFLMFGTQHVSVLPVRKHVISGVHRNLIPLYLKLPMT